MTGKEGPIMSKWIYKPVPAFSNYFNVEWIMSLLGFMIFIGHQSRMGWQMYAWKKEGILHYPASVFPSRQSSRIHESAYNIFSTTTRSIRSKTVIYYDDAKHSDASMFLKGRYPTENDMSIDAGIIQWHSLATKKQRCNVDNDALASCGNPAKTMSKQGNPSANHRLQGGSRLPLHVTSKPLEHNLLCIMAHAVFAATAHAFADTKRNKNQDKQAKTRIAHAVFASNKDGVSHMQYSRPAHRQLSLIGQQCRQTRSGAYMARGPRLFSPTVQSAPWSYQSTSNNSQMMPMPDIRLKFTSGSYPPLRAACSTKPQRTMSNLRVLFFQFLSARRTWNITKRCSTPRPRRMKTSTSSPLASLVGHLELLPKEPAYDQRLVRSGASYRAKHIGTLLCDAQEEDYNKPTQHVMFAPMHMQLMFRLAVYVFVPNPRTVLAQSKPMWNFDCVGNFNPCPNVGPFGDEWTKTISQLVNSWGDVRYSSASSKNLLATHHARYLEVSRTENFQHAETLLSTTKRVVQNESELDTNEDDRAEHFHEVMSMETEDLGLELENDRPLNDVGNALPETVCSGPHQSRSRTRQLLFRYPSPNCLSDDEDDGSPNDSNDVQLSADEYAGDSSNQATAKSESKPNQRTVIVTQGTATSRAPKAGAPTPTKGNASGARSAPRPFRPPTAAAHAAAMRTVWPMLSAPGATISDQHDDAPHNATKFPDDALGADSDNL